MNYSAKYALPHTSWYAFHNQAIDRVLENRLNLFVAPPGYLMTDVLAHELTTTNQPVLWIRLAFEDVDPASLLISLIQCARKIEPDVGAETLDQMRRYPGLLHGWARLYALFAEELLAKLPVLTLVIEHIQRLKNSQPALNLLLKHVFQKIRPPGVGVIISQQPLPEAALPPTAARHGISDLSLDGQSCIRYAQQEQVGLPDVRISRAVRLVDGSPVALAGIFSACLTLGAAYVGGVIDQAPDQEQLLARISRAWLASATGSGLQSLGMSMALDYIHPEMTQAVIGKAVLARGPWLQALDGEWCRVRLVWQQALRKALKFESHVQEELIRRAADYLVGRGFIDAAVPYYLQIRDYERAAGAMALVVDDYMNSSRWLTLQRWLAQIPAAVMHAWPWLVYTQAEIQSARGEIAQARQNFSRASKFFIDRNIPEGVCQSLAAESALAVRQGDLRSAQVSALQAHTQAHAAGLSWHQTWINWQLGCLALAMERSELAQGYFNAALTSSQDPAARSYLLGVSALAEQKQAMVAEGQKHRRAYQEIQTAVDELSKRLDLELQSPQEHLPALLGEHSWMELPLALKLARQETISPIEEPGGHNWVQALLQRFRGRPHERETELPEPGAETQAGLNLLEFPLAVALPRADLPLQKAITPDMPMAEDKPIPTAAERAAAGQAHLIIYSLGPLRVIERGRYIETWPSRKALLIFKYLLMNRVTPVAKEILMNVFWPEADGEAARRSLHQAIYILRQTLKGQAEDRHYILFDNDSYALDPEVTLWIDAEVFERYCLSGQHYERNGLVEQALENYRLAEQMYEDHFMSEDLYEDWIQARRQYLWQLYLATATRLAQHYFTRGELQLAISIAQRILSKDKYQEEAYRILMRCYQRQGQRQLAILQYRLCTQNLAEGLDIAPSEETRRIYESLLAA